MNSAFEYLSTLDNTLYNSVIYVWFCYIHVFWTSYKYNHDHVDGLVQDCSNSIANAVELLQSYTKLSMWQIKNDILTYHVPWL